MKTYIRAVFEGHESVLDGPEHEDYASLALHAGKVYGMVHSFPPGVPRFKHPHGTSPGLDGHASLDLHGLSVAQLRAVLKALRETP